MITQREMQRYLKAIRGNLEKLEKSFNEGVRGGSEPKPQDRRTELLEQIHVLGVVDQHQLFRSLDQRGIPHTWIGAQSRAEYLEMWSAAGGNMYYRVTDKAVRELSLGRMMPISDFAGLSEPIISEDWNSIEDAAYDNL